MIRWLAGLLLLCGPALAQTGTAVTPTPTDLLGSTGVCATAPAINATQAAGTCTISVPTGQHLYINLLQVGVCGDNTTNTVNLAQLTFTSTNLNGWQQQFSYLQGATAGTPGVFVSCQYIGGYRTHPLVSAPGPVSVTLVPPAQQAHSAYPINVEYFLAQ